MLRLLRIDYYYLPKTTVIRVDLWECYVNLTICNIELQMKQISPTAGIPSTPFLSIVISTTITIITITITTITITSIGNCTLCLFFRELDVTPPNQRSPIHLATLPPAKPLSQRPAKLDPHYQLARSKARFTAPSEARSTATSLLASKPECQSWGCSCLRDQIPPTESEFLATREAMFTPTSEDRCTTISLPPAMRDCQRGESDHVKVVGQSKSGVKKWLCQSCVSEQISGESEYVRLGVEAIVSELLEWACQSCGSELVGVMRVRAYPCQSSQ